VDLATVATAFATVFVAELPDKTMVATIVLSARFHRPLAVWAGAASALTLQMAVAVVAGKLLSLLPDAPVKFGVAALFAVGAVMLWRSQEQALDSDREIAGDTTPTDPRSLRLPFGRVAATVFGVVFVAEWGDLTQLATASLATRRPPLSVFIGASMAMICVSAIGVVAGRGLLGVLPERLLHRGAAIVFAVLSVVFSVDAVRSV
jgi:putative Ca2+/H+ antiporter (TMEM165/GDT1 family)